MDAQKSKLREKYFSNSLKNYFNAEKLFKKQEYFKSLKYLLSSMIVSPFRLYSWRMLLLIIMPQFVVKSIRKIKYLYRIDM
jgi:hypothetical protein